jgi:hypothetical protein
MLTALEVVVGLCIEMSFIAIFAKRFFGKKELFQLSSRM